MVALRAVAVAARASKSSSVQSAGARASAASCELIASLSARLNAEALTFEPAVRVIYSMPGTGLKETACERLARSRLKFETEDFQKYGEKNLD